MDGRVESLRTRLCGAPRRRQARILIGMGTLPRGASRKMFARGVGGGPGGKQGICARAHWRPEDCQIGLLHV